jgi:hypothetical protein
MADKKKTILAILGAAFLIVIIFAVLAIASLAYFIRTHVSAGDASNATAVEEIARMRERYAGQTPMIEKRAGSDEWDDDRFVIHRPEPGATAAPVQMLRVLAYNSHDERILRASIPFWILRLAPNGHFNILDTADIDMRRSHLSIEDLEHHGPGLIIDTEDARGSRVLVWLE